MTQKGKLKKHIKSERAKKNYEEFRTNYLNLYHTILERQQLKDTDLNMDPRKFLEETEESYKSESFSDESSNEFQTIHSSSEEETLGLPGSRPKSTNKGAAGDARIGAKSISAINASAITAPHLNRASSQGSADLSPIEDDPDNPYLKNALIKPITKVFTNLYSINKEENMGLYWKYFVRSLQTSPTLLKVGFRFLFIFYLAFK
jgi:hypothetical protein